MNFGNTEIELDEHPGVTSSARVSGGNPSMSPARHAVRSRPTTTSVESIPPRAPTGTQSLDALPLPSLLDDPFAEVALESLGSAHLASLASNERLNDLGVLSGSIGGSSMSVSAPATGSSDTHVIGLDDFDVNPLDDFVAAASTSHMPEIKSNEPRSAPQDVQHTVGDSSSTGNVGATTGGKKVVKKIVKKKIMVPAGSKLALDSAKLPEHEL